MSKEFKRLQQLHEDKIIFISYKKVMDPFQMWLWWFSGLFSNVQKRNPIFIFLYVLYYILTNFIFWIIVSIIMVIFIDKLFLLFIISPSVISFIFRPVGHGFLTYDILKNEKMFDILWGYGLIGGILSIKTDKNNRPEKHIWSYRNKDWRYELMDKF